MALPALQMEGGLLHRSTTSGRWTCTICRDTGPDGVSGFYRHYMRDHYGNTSISDHTHTRTGTAPVREMRNSGRTEMEHPSQETSRHGRIEGSDDVITGESAPALW